MRIPRTTFAERRAALSRTLTDRDIPVWIAFGDDRAFAGANHVRWLSDLNPHFEPVLLVGGAGGATTILTGPESVGYTTTAVEGTDVDRIAAMRELLHPGLEYKSVPMLDGVATILELLGGATRLGVMGWENVPAGLAAKLDGPFGEAGVDLVDVADACYALRAIKTADEQAVLDEAFAIAALGMREAAAAIRPGATERSVAAAAEAAMRAAGAEGFSLDTMVSSGVEHTRRVLARTTFREIDPGDLVTVTVLPRYEGYHAALARPFLIGPNDQLERMVDVAFSAQRAARELLHEGVEGRKAAAACLEVVAKGKTEAAVADVWVHSTGVVEFEPPVFDDSLPDTLQEGMAINLDIPIFEAPWGGLRVEDGFAIENGAARPRIVGHEELVPIVL